MQCLYRSIEILSIDDYLEDLTERPVPATIPPSTAIIDPPEARSSTQEATQVQDASQEVTEAELATHQDVSTPTTTPAPSRNASPTPPPIPLATTNPSNSALMAQCRSFLDELQRGAAPWIVQRLASTYGDMPTDVSSFSYWVASILPIDDHEKAKLLPIRSPRLRLLLVVHWIEQLNNNWYNVFYPRVVTRGLLLIGILFFFWPVLSVHLADFIRWFSSGCGIV